MPRVTPLGRVVPVIVTVNVSSASKRVSFDVVTDRVPLILPAAMVNESPDTAVKSVPEAAVTPAVLQASTVSAAATPESLTVNSAIPPSATLDAVVAATDTVSMPSSTIVVVAAVASTPTSPTTAPAAVSVTIWVSPRSSTSSALVWSLIAPLETPDSRVSVPPGSLTSV